MKVANTSAIEDPGTRVPRSSNAEPVAIPWLVIGMGSVAYGKERRAVTALKHTPCIRPHFLTTVWEDGSVSELLRANRFEFTPVTIGYLGRARLRWTLLNIRFMPHLFWTVLRVYRAQRCQGVLVLALLPFANVLPALLILKVLFGARLVFYLGDIPADTRPNRALCRMMEWTSHSIIVNSEAVRRGLEKLGLPSEKVSVLYNGLALERFGAAVPFAWREQFGWSADILLVGYAGQFAPNKGVDDFLRAAERVIECTDRCRFVFVGKKDETNRCYRELARRIHEQRLEEKIVFPGWTSEMERAYAALDLIVVPSRHEEAASNVIIEAMASGLAVIATRTGGTPELVRDGATGFLVEKQKPEEIAEKILLFVSDPGLLARLGVAAREHARACFNAEHNALQLQETMLLALK
jgi:glycosyltransferase involved in cell wall biosynthesis